MANEATVKAKEEVKPDPKRGLVVKLCEIMAAVGYTQKTGWNEAQRYHYVTEADIAEKIRPELAKRNIFIFPHLVSNTRTQLIRSKKYKDVVEEKVTYATDVIMRWTIVDGDTGEERVCEMPGCSESPGDKGVYVAMTGSEKYLLVKGFLLPTGDDPEDDSNETDGKGSREAAQAVGQEKIKQLEAKMGKKSAPAPSNAVPSLFYALQPSGRYSVTGDIDLMRKIYPQFKATLGEDKEGKFYMLNEAQLEVLKFECEEGKVPLHVLKGPNEV